MSENFKMHEKKGRGSEMQIFMEILLKLIPFHLVFVKLVENLAKGQ